MDRREFIKQSALTATSALAFKDLSARETASETPNFTPKCKRVIYLFMAGGPSQIDLFDYKPQMKKWFNKDIPAEIRKGQRLTNMTANQAKFPIAPSIFDFAQHGQSGQWISELLPHTASIVDELAIIKSVHTEAINHDPAKTLICTGSQLPGMASIGSWINYALKTENPNLPGHVVLNCSKFSGKVNVQGLYSRLWGSGFLPSKHQGTLLQSAGDPVLYLSNPAGVTPSMRSKMLDFTSEFNKQKFAQIGDPEILTSIAQQEMAIKMQSSVPELTDFSSEPEYIYNLYGKDAKIPGTFAYNCLLARRMAERDVRFTMLFHRGWDHHGKLPENLRAQCGDIDQPTKALILDLKQRGLLDDTLVIWGGEFGRTIFSQGILTANDYGRDHHPKCFTMWMAGGCLKSGISHGETDDFSYNITKNPVHIRDINATILRLLGLDHNQLTYSYQGLDMKLTGVDEAHVIKEILA
jgi:hypothetical protein